METEDLLYTGGPLGNLSRFHHSNQNLFLFTRNNETKFLEETSSMETDLNV